MSSPGLESGSVSTPVYSTYEVKKNQKETKNIDTNYNERFWLHLPLPYKRV